MPAAHLLAATTGDGRTLTQPRVPDKTNEITCFAALLEPFGLTGIVVTADAPHTRRGHAVFLARTKGAHYASTMKITRHRTSLKTGKRTRETDYVITGLHSRDVSPERIARLIRARWVIENRPHFVRDVTFDEDRSQVRTGHGPENMATLRDLAINRLREHGRTNIDAGLREMSYQGHDPVRGRIDFQHSSRGTPLCRWRLLRLTSWCRGS